MAKENEENEENESAEFQKNEGAKMQKVLDSDTKNLGDVVYFAHKMGLQDSIYIGYSGQIEKRIQQHDSGGNKVYAFMRGGKDLEQLLHDFFIKDLDTDTNSKSFYKGERIHNYVEWLVQQNIATTVKDEILHLPQLPWSSCGPHCITTCLSNENGQGLWTDVANTHLERVAQSMLTPAYLQSTCNEWWTSPIVIEKARLVLGEIDLDPASCPTANRLFVKAKYFYSEKFDGMCRSWDGRIWLNPPYGPDGKKFVRKFIDELDKGNAKEGLILLNSNSMSSAWFHKTIFDRSQCIFVTGRRLHFHPGTPQQRCSDATTGSVICYFGPNLAKFIEVFTDSKNLPGRFIQVVR